MKDDFKHPYDTILSSGLRFSAEVLAWVAGPMAIATFYGWLWMPVLLILVLLPAIFSTTGDKRKVVVATPGFLRVLIELLLYTVAVFAPWFIWPAFVCFASNVMVLASLILGWPRLVWLLSRAGNT